jgi:hypothetical protein
MKIAPPISIARQSRAFKPPPDSGVESGKSEVVDTLLDRGSTPELEGASPTQRDLLQANLGRVDRGLLLWAQQQGVKLQVLRSGEELEATGALRDLADRFDERMKPETVQAVHAHLSDLSDRIRNEKDPKKAPNLRRQKRQEMAEILTNNPCGAAVFTPAFAPLLAPGLSKLAADPTETPTLKGMALHHGADSAEEQEKFYSWMENLNGDRLETARQQSIEERSRLLQDRPQALKRWLKQAAEKPETVPLDATLHTLVVPDAHFLSSGAKENPLLLDRSDLRSVEGWRNGDFRGQWFFLEGKTHLLVRDSALELNTPVHELGHVIDMTLEKQAPEFYAPLRPQIEKAHYQARLHGHAITNYAMANRREYIAEGFAAYYDKPGKLRQVDPELYRLVDKMVEFCCDKAGANRNLDHRLEKMWQHAVQIDHTELEPSVLTNHLEEQIKTTPNVEALSQTAMTTALRASQLGLLTGAAEVALGVAKDGSEIPRQTMSDCVQQAYREGLDIQAQQDLFELGYQYGTRI